MGTRDIDALWQEMAMENEYKGVEISRHLKKSMARTSKSFLTRTAVTRTTPRVDPVVSIEKNVVVTHENIFNLPKVLNSLAADQKSARKKAAMALERHFLKDDIKDQLVSGDSLTAEIFADMAKQLFRRFNDQVEKVREICIRITTKCIRKEEDLLRYLPYLIPAITNRVNSHYAYDEENQTFSRDQYLHDAFKRGRVYITKNQVTWNHPNEPSEEIRLLLVGLVDAVLQNVFERRASSILHAYIFDILILLISGVHDSFHEINISSCRLLASMSNHMVSAMKHFSVATVRTVMPLLLHRLARVRVAAIEMIRAVVICPNVDKCKGSGTEAIVDLIGHRDENVIPVASFYTAEVRLNYFARLDQDQNATVRRAFFAMISDWMVNLLDRYDHESRLLPYLLSAVSDEDVTIATQALKTLEILGENYEQEHAKEVMEIKQYGMDGKNPAYNFFSPLPAPFTAERPSLGTRLFVRGRARRFLNPILRELANWQESTRAHAVRLLKCVLVYCEETITVDTHLLVTTLLQTWHGDHHLLPELQNCADLTGRYVAPSTYLPLVLSRIRGDSDIAIPRCATEQGNATAALQAEIALKVLQCMMEGSLEKMLLPHVPEILDTIGSPLILELESEGVKLALGQLLVHITKLLERSGSDAVTAIFLERGRLTSMKQSFSRIFDIGVIVTASSYCSAAVVAASNALQQLATLESLPDVGQLYVRHSPPLLQRVLQNLRDMLKVTWSPNSATQLALEQLLSTTPVTLLLDHGEELTSFFGTILQPTQAVSTATLSRLPIQNSSQQSTTTAERNVAMSQRAREQCYEQIIRKLVARVQTEGNQQQDFSVSLVETSYTEHWASLITQRTTAA